MRRERFVHLGYTVGRGEAVMLPIRHMVVTGQTQESGKTTTLEALIARADAGRGKGEPRFRAIAFITKRGEGAFGAGHQVPPYFRTQKADWQYVSSLIDVTMGEKNKLLRSFLMKTCRNTKTLADVLVNVRAAKDSSKGFPESIYTEIEGYLELVVPQLAQLPPAHKLTLKAGLNVMDVSTYTTELQALVLRAVLDHVQDHEEDVVVVVPEAWEFLPEGRGSPVKAAAERLVRQGAGLGNYLWIDSQDLGGVWKTVVRACPVALVGVQREANEIKRTLANIHTPVKPKAVDVAGLELGEFYACWGKHAEKTYVQPAGMEHRPAMAIARGEQARTVWRSAPRKRVVASYVGDGQASRTLTTEQLVRPTATAVADSVVDRVTRGSEMEPIGSILERVTRGMRPGDERTIELPTTSATQDTLDQVKGFVARGFRAQARVDTVIAAHAAKETFMSDQAEQKLDQLLKRFDGFVKMMNDKYGGGTAYVGAPTIVLDDPEGAAMRGRKLEERSDRELEDLAIQLAPVVLEQLLLLAERGDPRIGAIVLQVTTSQPELAIKVQKHTIVADDTSIVGRIGLLISEGFFDSHTTAYSAWVELGKRNWKHDRRTAERAVAELATKGFLRKESDGYIVVGTMKRNVKASA